MPRSAQLNRRRFLTLLGAVGLSTAASQRLEPWIRDCGDGFCPGAAVKLQVAPDVPPGCLVRMAARHASGSAAGPAVPAVPGAAVVAETPYPFHDLVPGRYYVEAELLGPDGSLLQRLSAGGYAVRAYRFSA